MVWVNDMAAWLQQLTQIDLEQVVFYLFSAILLGSATVVVATRQPVKAVLCLILAFFAAAVLWMLLSAEFLSLVLLFVYVGAVMTLFLFVCMMLNVNTLPSRRGWVAYLPVATLVAAGLFYSLSRLVQRVVVAHQLPVKLPPGTRELGQSNIKALGGVLYTQYVIAFELAAVILLVAIVAAIGITFRGRRAQVRSQRIAQQLAANKSDRLRVVDLRKEGRS